MRESFEVCQLIKFILENLWFIFENLVYVYNYFFVLISILKTMHRLCHTCMAQYLHYVIPKYTKWRISPISHIGLIRHGHAILQSYFIKRLKDIFHVMYEGQISSRTLMSLSMIRQVPINQRYGYLVTDNIWMEIKHLRWCYLEKL